MHQAACLQSLVLVYYSYTGDVQDRETIHTKPNKRYQDKTGTKRRTVYMILSMIKQTKAKMLHDSKCHDCRSKQCSESFPYYYCIST
jgi:hypothetical protein